MSNFLAIPSNGYSQLDEVEQQDIQTVSLNEQLVTETESSSYQYDRTSSKNHVSGTNEVGKSKASLFSVSAALTNNILGAGVLGIPHAFSQCGYVLGMVLLTLAGCGSAFALHLLASSALHLGGSSSFFSLANASIPKYAFLIDLAVAVKCFGVATSYLIIVGDLMPEAMEQLDSHSFFQHRTFWISIGLAIVTPLAFLPTLQQLKFTSTLAVVFVMFLTVMVVIYSFYINSSNDELDPCNHLADDNIVCPGKATPIHLSTKIFPILSIFIFAFTCHQNIFTVCNEIRRPSIERVNQVIINAIGTGFVVYSIIALAAYFTYGESISSDMLESYPQTRILTVARIFICLVVLFTYPLQAHPGRKSCLGLIKTVLGEVEDESTQQYYFRYTVVTVVFLTTTYFIAVSVTDLGIILSIVGATGSTLISYILPGFLYLKLFENKMGDWKRTGARAMFAIGMFLVPFCLTVIFVFM